MYRSHKTTGANLLLVAIALGLIGCVLDVPIDIVHEPIRVSLIFGSVLPMVVAMAWGWKAGAAAAVLGLAGFYPFMLWPNNGWANVMTSCLSCMWFIWHGWAADRRAAHPGRWRYNPYVVELLYELLYILYVLTIFRWSFALNPAPWTPTATTEMPLEVAWLIACKSPLNGLVVVLLADTILHIAPVRRLLRLPVPDERRMDTWIAIAGISASLIVWMTDSLVAVLVKPETTWWQEAIAPEPRQLLSRLLLATICMVGALVVAGIVRHRRRLGLQLQDSLAQHHHILQTAMDGFWQLDSDGRIREANQAYALMSGYPLEGLRGMHVADLEGDESPSEVAAHLHRVKEIGNDRFETRHRRKDGSRFDVEVSVQFRPEQGGYFFCFLRDISERKRAVEVLELERTLYKDLVATMPVGVYRCTVHYAKPLQRDTWVERVELNLVSDAFCRILGVSREACASDAAIVVGRIHPDDLAEFSRLNVLGQTSLVPFNWEGRILRDNEVRWVHFASTPRKLDGGDVIWTGILADITDRKRAEADRQRLEEHLRQLEKMDAIGQLAGGVAHDFNNQLSGILGYADLLEVQLDDPKLKRYAASIVAAANRSADLAQRLLAFARKGKFRSIPVDMHALLEDVATLLRRGIDKRIVVTVELHAATCMVMGDPTQLQNMLLNLGLNARDAMPHGGQLTLSTRISSEGSPGERNEAPALEVCVSDTGIGMDAETQRRLFEPFFTTKEVGKGTGLGLASCYGTVKNHGGSIRVWSETGHGSRFTVSLPLFDRPLAETAPPGEPVGEVRSCLIMIVDDETSVIAVVADMLHDLGYRVVVQSDPAEALVCYRARWQDIGLVILDMVMPGMGGRDLFSALRAVNPQIRAVLSSGYSLDGEAQSILDDGVRSFVQKPFNRASLARAIEAALGQDA